MKPILIVCVLLFLGGVAHAQDVDCDTFEGTFQIKPATGDEYTSPLREFWFCEVKKDANLKADIDDSLRLSVHRQEADTFTRNNKHVVIAYIAIWVLTAAFVLWAFMRQQSLKGEIERLRADLGRAMKDEK